MDQGMASWKSFVILVRVHVWMMNHRQYCHVDFGFGFWCGSGFCVLLEVEVQVDVRADSSLDSNMDLDLGLELDGPDSRK